MIKKAIAVDVNKVDENMLSLVSEFESMGYAKDGYLNYEESDRVLLSDLYRKYGYVFLD